MPQHCLRKSANRLFGESRFPGQFSLTRSGYRRLSVINKSLGRFSGSGKQENVMRTWANLTLTSYVGMILALGLCAGLAANVQAETPPGKHPLDPVLKLAEDGLQRMRKEIDDYRCTMIRRERIKGKLGEYNYMEAAIRSRKTDKDGKVIVPLSAYLKFTKPSDIKGREVVWVEGKNNGKMWVKEPLLLGASIPVWINPTGALAMAECKYPITDIGLENLLAKLLERGKKDRERDRPEECEVKTTKNVKVEGRPCSLISIRHPKQRPEYDYYLAQVFIDDEYQLPTRYAAYNFPDKEGDEPPVEEEYTYLDMEFNVGLDDKFFAR
jgi:hypothetical protein